MPALLDGHGLAFHVGGIAGELLEVLADIVKMLEALIQRDREVGRQRVVDEEDRRLLLRLGREEDLHVVLLVELLDPG